MRRIIMKALPTVSLYMLGAFGAALMVAALMVIGCHMDTAKVSGIRAISDAILFGVGGVAFTLAFWIRQSWRVGRPPP